MSLPDQLLLSDLLARRVRCDQGLDHGIGQLGWMHPPVHRLLGWVSRPSALSSRRTVWRLDQLRGLTEGEALVQGDPADTPADTLERLPTLFGAVLFSGSGEPLGRLADAAFELRSGRILHYLVARSDPRLPGGSRWRLSPDRIVDQRPGEVATALEGLADLPLARASLRETLLRRSRRWRDQWDEETTRLRDQWQQASGRFEDRLEGWLEEPPWDEPHRERPEVPRGDDLWPEEPWPPARERAPMPEQETEPDSESWEPWLDEEVEEPQPDWSRPPAGRGPVRGSRSEGRRGGVPASDFEQNAPQGWEELPPDPPRDRWSERDQDPRRTRPGAAPEESDDPWV